MKIYTKTGDGGYTGLYKSKRVAKDDAIIEALGTIDELNSWFGVFNSDCTRHDVIGLIYQIQKDLFEIGAIMATQEGYVTDIQVEYLEEHIDRLEATNEPLKNFILPTGTKGCAMIHHARTICRRVERRVFTAIFKHYELRGQENILKYFNRLSDLCFVLARNINQRPEIIWVSDK